MQKQVEEANAKVVQEREAARRAIEEAPPVIKETPVIVQDTEKINALSAEVESLKVWFHYPKVYYLYSWTQTLVKTANQFLYFPCELEGI